MRQVQLVYRYQIARLKNIFVHTINPCAAEINHAERLDDFYDLTDTVKFRRGTIVYQVTRTQVISGPPMIRHDHGQSVESIWQSF